MQVALFTTERRAAKRKAKEIYTLLTNTQITTTQALNTADREERKICNGNAVLYKRENTSKLSARIKRVKGAVKSIEKATTTGCFRIWQQY